MNDDTNSKPSDPEATPEDATQDKAVQKPAVPAQRDSAAREADRARLQQESSQSQQRHDNCR